MNLVVTDTMNLGDKKDKNYGQVAKRQTFSSTEGLKRLHEVKMECVSIQLLLPHWRFS